MRCRTVIAGGFVSRTILLGMVIVRCDRPKWTTGTYTPVGERDAGRRDAREHEVHRARAICRAGGDRGDALAVAGHPDREAIGFRSRKSMFAFVIARARRPASTFVW